MKGKAERAAGPGEDHMEGVWRGPKKIVKLRRLGLSLTFPNPSPTTSCDMSAKKEFSCHSRV